MFKCVRETKKLSKKRKETVQTKMFQFLITYAHASFITFSTVKDKYSIREYKSYDFIHLPCGFLPECWAVYFLK